MSQQGIFPGVRLRRLRQTESLRQLVRETHLDLKQSILPLFIKEGLQEKQPIRSMPGHFQLSLYDLADEIRALKALNIHSVILFGIPSHKDATGSSAFSDTGIIQQAIPIIKDVAPEMLVLADVCCCEYTDHGHCGVLHQKHNDWEIENDSTLTLLGQQSISLAKAGCDMIAPSGMMDGQVRAIRQALDSEGFTQTPIMSYAAKYSSSFYGPFREAAEGAPKMGNRKSYQMDPANGQEALREVALDVEEGADILMVKPALSYLDVICRIKQAYPCIPLAAYHVSGEFAMIKAVAQQGLIDETQAMLEVLTSIKRAGADILIHYFVKDLAKVLAKQ